MFHKFSKNQFKQTLRNLKSHALHGYHQAKNIAGHIDHGVSIAKEIYRVLEPAINTYAGNHGLHGHAMKALTGYENLRNQAMEINNHVTTIGNKLSGLI